MKDKAIFNWSGGKDSALCLHHVLNENRLEVVGLLTSVSKEYQRISMHGVRVELLERQAAQVGIPLTKMEVPEMPTMEAYEKAMEDILEKFKNEGVSHSVFGDIFLEDLRAYREKKLALLNLKGVFPLWKKSTKKIIHEFLDLGFKTITTCVNEKYLDKSFAGRIIDHDFLNDLPAGVDPCGENGEFHTFVFDGPIFSNPIDFTTGEIVYRKYSPPSKDEKGDECNNQEPFDTGFFYCDLLPA
ncbi:MAG: diphthine--ammonia ligase [Bacteroidetes bacterium]|nr:diphthine--ammonia ligase [Bacteroidota bacterium]